MIISKSLLLLLLLFLIFSNNNDNTFANLYMAILIREYKNINL
jgi:hypothetical protein